MDTKLCEMYVIFFPHHEYDHNALDFTPQLSPKGKDATVCVMYLQVFIIYLHVRNYLYFVLSTLISYTADIHAGDFPPTQLNGEIFNNFCTFKEGDGPRRPVFEQVDEFTEK